MSPRRFSRSQRAALYLAADGRCSDCGAELEPGWHADHIDPWSRGGVTDVTNGRATCARCNLRKGYRVDLTPRGWQQRFIAKYHANQEADFLCVACPGAGKTLAAGFIARDLFRAGEIDRVLVVVPSGPLRMQWHNALAQLDVIVDGSTMNNIFGEMETIEGQRAYGWVVTYQSLAQEAALHRMLNGKDGRRTLAILDEVHHLSTENSWGRSAIHALAASARRLSLSGTPFRGDGDEMPFVEYKDGWCRYRDEYDEDGNLVIYSRGFDYSYGAALNDRPSPVRESVFETFDGDVAWMEYGKDDPEEGRISDVTLDKEKRRKVNRNALNTAGDWLHDVLSSADRRLTMVREEGDNAAKGLVVCQDTGHAHEVAPLLSRIAGPGQVYTAVSKDSLGEDSNEEARNTIRRFGASEARWLVAVAMVSEGVDIPQMRIGVYATTVRTELFFRQVLGRFVRHRSDLPEEIDQTAYLFVPKDPTTVAFADGVQDEVKAALLNEDREAEEGGANETSGYTQPTLDYDSFLSSTSEAGGILLPGRGSVDHELVEKLAAEAGVSASNAASVLSAARTLGLFAEQESQSATPLSPQAASQPSYDEKITSKKNLLEKNLKQITSGIVRHNGSEFSDVIARIKTDIYSRAGIYRGTERSRKERETSYKRADLPQVDEALRIVREILEQQ